jgi:hypothetical protein
MALPAAAAVGIQAGASILGGIFGRKSAKKKARAARAMAQYNASVARMNAESEAQAIESQERRLTKQQRELQAQQEMSVAGRGGVLAGGDLLSFLDQAQEMQLDKLELIRQRDLATISGENRARGIIYQGQQQAAAAKAEGRAAMTQGILGAAGSIAGGFASGALKFPTKPVIGGSTTNILRQYGSSNIQQSFGYQDFASKYFTNQPQFPSVFNQ